MTHLGRRVWGAENWQKIRFASQNYIEWSMFHKVPSDWLHSIAVVPLLLAQLMLVLILSIYWCGCCCCWPWSMSTRLASRHVSYCDWFVLIIAIRHVIQITCWGIGLHKSHYCLLLLFSSQVHWFWALISLILCKTWSSVVCSPGAVVQWYSIEPITSAPRLSDGFARISLLPVTVI